MPRAERGMPGRTMPALISSSITPEVNTEAEVTATVISRSSPVLA
jgi:hypothetical protein